MLLRKLFRRTITAAIAVVSIGVGGAACSLDVAEKSSEQPVHKISEKSGTDLAAGLSNTDDEASGTWPRPEGFVGLWFEEEPEDSRERVVWESQKFVGTGEEIPLIELGEGEDQFAGLPDICGEEVKSRMDALGYESLDELGENQLSRHSCFFEEKPTDTNFFMEDGVMVALISNGADLVRSENTSEYSSLISATAYEHNTTGDPDFCGLISREKLQEHHLVTVANFGLNRMSKRANCDINTAYWQVASNVLGGIFRES